MLAIKIRSALMIRLSFSQITSVNAYSTQIKKVLNDTQLPAKKKFTKYQKTSQNDEIGSARREFKVSESRDLKKFIYRGRSAQFMDGLKETENDLDPEKLFELEKDLDTFVSNEKGYHDTIIQDDIKKRSSIKLGIIKKKMKRLSGDRHTYFNLLTWDAKEQIKHLSLEDPNMWTPEKIAESYPIDIENVKKLLRSKWSPKTLDELARHDEKVIQNWKKLAECVADGEARGPAVNFYEDMMKSNRMALMKHACGLPGVDFKRSATIFSDSFDVHEAVLALPGKFSSLIKRDDVVKNLFRKQELGVRIDKLAVTEKSSFDDYLATTKRELAKSLTRILKTDTKLDAQNTQYSPVKGRAKKA